MLRIGSDLTSRRDFSHGRRTCGTGGLSLSNLLRARAVAAQQKLPITDKSVIFVFMHGGPSQIETFDPKMTAPAGVCSVNGEVATSLPGVTYGSAFPRLAARAHETTVVRSFKTGDGNHDIKPIVGKATGGANLGTLYARVAGGNRPHSGMPTNAILYPRAVDPATQPRIRQFGDFETAGPFGGAFSPFAPSGGGDLKSDLKIHLPMDRIDDRRHLLAGLDRIRRSLDSDEGMQGIDSLRQQAFDTLLGGVADAFNLSREDPAIVRRYDTAPLVRPDQISRRLHNYPYYVDQRARPWGKLLLLARRLCERGCGFVTVTTSFVWDMHADVNNAGVDEGMRYMAPPFDHAISAFLEDVAARGLSDRILLVCCGEMGRTPRINSRGGRDHWGDLALAVAGSGREN